MPTPAGKESVTSPVASTVATRQELPYRLRQQSLLKDAASRITTIAQVHHHLWRSTRIGFVDIADLVGELCRKLQETLSHNVNCTFGQLTIC